MNKRGAEDKLFFIMWELIAFAVVLIIIIIVVRGVANDSTYWKNYYSRDLGLMADIENINQGDFFMDYELLTRQKSFWTDIYFIDKPVFDITLKEDRIEVYDYPREDSKYPTTYPFAKNKNINVINESSTSDFLVLSKIGDKLKISTHAVEDAEVCPSYDTSKDSSLIKFNSIYLDDKVKPHSASVKAILQSSRYGKGQNAVNESTIILGYAENFTIYYSNDANTLQSQKLACIFKMKFLEKYNNTPEIVKYDSSLDSNPQFSDYIAGKEHQEYWIIIMLSQNEIKISQNDFAIIVENAVKEYYD